MTVHKARHRRDADMVTRGEQSDSIPIRLKEIFPGPSVVKTGSLGIPETDLMSGDGNIAFLSVSTVQSYRDTVTLK